eukprot:COSAG02_NODE_8425_length_2575_cov_4.168821_4_plen_73_part_00
MVIGGPPHLEPVVSAQAQRLRLFFYAVRTQATADCRGYAVLLYYSCTLLYYGYGARTAGEMRPGGSRTGTLN